MGNGRHVEAFNEASVRFAVAVDGIVDGACVALFENGDVDDFHLLLALVFGAFRIAYEHLVLHTRHLVRSVAVEDDDIVDGRAVFHELVLFERRAHKSVFAVDVKFLRGLDHFGGLDIVEAAQFGVARMFGGIFVVNQAEPVGRHLHHVLQVLVDARHLVLHARNHFVSLLLVELQDAPHFYFHEAQDVIARHLAVEILLERFEARIDVCHGGIHVACLFKLAVLVDALLDEDAFERGEVQALHEFAPAYE